MALTARQFYEGILRPEQRPILGIESWLWAATLFSSARPGFQVVASGRVGHLLEPEVFAYVDHDRWVADCPFRHPDRPGPCGGAAMVEPGQDRWLCPECLNRAVGGATLVLRWPHPSTRRAVEEILAARPLPEQRN